MSIILPEQLSELTSMKRWVCHLDKVPKNPFTGGNAMADNSSTWGTYAEAVSAIDRFHFHGLGFQFGLPWDEAEAFELERITGIDLDHVIRDDGSLVPFANEVVSLMDSYTEFSPSGTGLHILCKAKFPNTGRRKNVSGTENCMIELYNYAHYFTVTGNIYGEPKNIEVRTTQLEALFKKFFDDIHSAPPMVTDFAPSKIIHHEHLRDINHFLADISSDNELLDKMFNSRNGYAIRKLFSGNTTGYASHSEADMALVSHLAYWTNGDFYRIDALFRSSGLMREKWDELHGGSTYGQRTIDIVLRDFQPYVPFTPVLQNSQVRSTSYGTTLETPNTKNQTSSPYEINDTNTNKRKYLK